MGVNLNHEYERWCSWLRDSGRIRKDVYGLVYERQLWIGFELLATANEHDRKNSLFFTWVRESYLTSIASGIRVQSDLDTRSISMARLLHLMARYPKAVTRTRYLEERDAASKESHYWDWANKGFDELAGTGNEYIDPAVPGHDLERLLEVAAPIRKIVNNSIAHANTDTNKFKGALRPERVSEAVDMLRDLVKKYSSHLANVDISPDWILPSWWAIFKEGWEIPDEVRRG